MDERKTFLETLQKTIRELQEAGIITEEQLKQKIDIPIGWFYSRDIDRNIMSRTMDNICGKINPNYSQRTKIKPFIDYVRICERNGKIIVEVPGRDGWTYFGLDDNSFHKEGKISYFSSDEFIQEMYKTIIESKREKIKVKTKNLSEEEISNIMEIMFDQKQQENETKGLSISLSEMIENFGEYYRYLHEEKEQMQTESNEIQVVSGGLIEQDVDQMDNTRARGNLGTGGNGKTERVNEIYPFEERDNIFRSLKPIQIISFDSIDENRQIQRGTYTSYVYRNKRENGGYFLISEPYKGDKACRAVYLTDEYINSLQEGEPNNDFWIDIARTYLELSGQDFHDEKSTYTFKHRALDTYSAKMKYIVSGEIDPNVSRSVIYSAKMNLSQLFGIDINKKKLTEIATQAIRSEIEAARRFITPRIQEKGVGGREE